MEGARTHAASHGTDMHVSLRENWPRSPITQCCCTPPSRPQEAQGQPARHALGRRQWFASISAHSDQALQPQGTLNPGPTLRSPLLFLQHPTADSKSEGFVSFFFFFPCDVLSGVLPQAPTYSGWVDDKEWCCRNNQTCTCRCRTSVPSQSFDVTGKSVDSGRPFDTERSDGPWDPLLNSDPIATPRKTLGLPVQATGPTGEQNAGRAGQPGTWKAGRAQNSGPRASLTHGNRNNILACVFHVFSLCHNM